MASFEPNTKDPELQKAWHLGARARNDCSDYVNGLLAQFAERERRRKALGIPCLALSGRGRSGKDFSAELLQQLSGGLMHYHLSTSGVVAPMIAQQRNCSTEEVFARRHEERLFWFHWCCGFRSEDPALLARLVASTSDFIIGTRSFIELRKAKDEDFLTATVWIENPRAPDDPTLEYGPEECDLVLWNAGSKSELYHKWKRLLELTGYLQTFTDLNARKIS